MHQVTHIRTSWPISWTGLASVSHCWTVPGRILLMISAFIASVPAYAQNPTDSIERSIQELITSKDRAIGGVRIAGTEFIERFYRYRKFRPAWSNDALRAELRRLVALSWLEGLNPADFHAQLIRQSPKDPAPQSKRNVAEQDIVQTDALIRLLYQLYFGKVSPIGLDPNWNFSRKLPVADPVSAISQALDDGKLAQLVDTVRIKHPFYSELKAALQAFTEYDVQGGWPQIPAGEVLKPGMADKRLSVLRQRLTITGEYAPETPAEADVYDVPLADAVKKFQERHGLDVDGVIGATTLAALNVKAADRVAQIKANLERARWVLRTVVEQKDLVLVNIAGFYLRLFIDGKSVWRTGVITGRPYHKTPVFTEDISYVVINPDWTVPRSIIRNEIFPKAKSDPAYLGRNNYKLVGSSGAAISPLSIDWTAMTARSFPYGVVQQPGENNALGLVKFIFPNPHNVYLHDTPSRQLFTKTGRAFSHGCIRVEDPMKLAELILGNRLGWQRAQIDAAVASKKLRRVDLPKKFPVAILYWTVDPMGGGQAKFYNDVYGRDARLIAALKAEGQIKAIRK